MGTVGTALGNGGHGMREYRNIGGTDADNQFFYNVSLGSCTDISVIS